MANLEILFQKMDTGCTQNGIKRNEPLELVSQGVKDVDKVFFFTTHMAVDKAVLCHWCKSSNVPIL